MDEKFYDDLVEMKSDIKVLLTKVDRLTKDYEEQKHKITTLESWQNRLIGAGVLGGALLGWMLSHAGKLLSAFKGI